MAAQLSPEFLLLAACSVWPPTTRRTAAICQAAARPLDWDRFLKLTIRHGVVGLVHEGLTAAEIAIPSSIAQEIKTLAGQLSLQSLALTAEAVRLQNAFDKSNMPILSVKGPSLAILLTTISRCERAKILISLSPAIFCWQQMR